MTFHAEVTDLGLDLNQGQAEIAYERGGRRWELTIRIAE